MTRTFFSTTFVALLLMTTALPASGQGTQPITGISTTTSVSVDGRITAVDPATRMVTVATSDGRTVTGKVSERVGNLGQLKVGDRIDAGYEEKMSFVLSGPNTPTPASRVVGGTVIEGGRQPAGASATQAVATWTVVSANTAASTISLVDPNSGPVHTYDVRTPEGKAELARVKPGDKLTAIYTELVFAAVTPKK